MGVLPCDHPQRGTGEVCNLYQLDDTCDDTSEEPSRRRCSVQVGKSDIVNLTFPLNSSRYRLSSPTSYCNSRWKRLLSQGEAAQKNICRLMQPRSCITFRRSSEVTVQHECRVELKDFS
ncbi:hypothetical protein F2P81_001619 [Scophthalmus maximus]|uniref:Uncharacterized protein n=1 Tax=Scophthalmus maximus TaxID=52904 RepID=A0A6A4TNB9_SCOMX|nr:hypothetical protein F2P81_001619 [Scophthalmus maximus]